MPSDYELMRMSEDEDEDAFEPDEVIRASDWEEDYLAYYDDCKLKNSTDQDW